MIVLVCSERARRERHFPQWCDSTWKELSRSVAVEYDVGGRAVPTNQYIISNGSKNETKSYLKYTVSPYTKCMP